MKKLTALLLILCLLSGYALGETLSLSVRPGEKQINPGTAISIAFTVPSDGTADLYLTDDSGNRVFTVAEDRIVSAGENGLWWNGTWQGENAPQGKWHLVLSFGGSTAEAALTVSSAKPSLSDVSAESNEISIEEPAVIHYYASTDGYLLYDISQDGAETQQFEQQLEAGMGIICWTPVDFRSGEVTITMYLMDHNGTSSDPTVLQMNLSGMPETADVPEAPAEDPDAPGEAENNEEAEPENDPEPEAEPEPEPVIFTPSYGSPYTDSSVSHWTTPMDITDEEAIWNMLIEPIWVINTTKKNGARTHIVLRQEPDDKSKAVGLITCLTQGVHVLENLDNGWSLVECYSSSFHDSSVKAWNMFVQGYVKTSLLKQVVPDQHIGYVVDKLTQRIYIFQDGHLLDTLLVSTGLANAKQPYNETRSGEFLLQVPAVGDFKSDNLTCSMGIRFNDGDLLHEVPHTKNNDGSKNFRTTDPKLGTKASHGCIRVQHNKTPQGINMRWIWDHKANNTKLIVWEDWQGRQIPYPADDTVLYYNPAGGDSFHSAETCNCTKAGVTFEPFLYSQLEDEGFAKLKRCTWCTPVMRRSEIDAINAVYAPGGDHDPVITKARQKYLDSLKH